MRNLTAIVAVNLQGVIGCGNALPWHVRSDLKFFRETTTGGTVIMGRKTFDSIGRPLPKRHNIVVSHNAALCAQLPNVQRVSSVEEAIFAASRLNRETFLVGGASMYSQMAAYVDRYLITLVHKDVHDGDAYFDEKIIGDLAKWNLSVVREKGPVVEGDDAAYEIWELNHPNFTEIRLRRDMLVRHFAEKNHFYRSVMGLREVDKVVA
ncbi:Dihydrofolate reductase [Sphingobium yanoikuyae]|uniref:dihydrofolate reductase n=1 Tax=Sphingobium yanoikuyae TaxID=13690 RepID=A0A084E9Q7_SPHYA|nr:dihydrofolate reductase [Sphingobium yanoikuyae]KEZ14699.1 Dihydrofolate reductase [Sphingobium yanoikuyae]